jgi:anti-sigma B factor antagonist
VTEHDDEFKVEMHSDADDVLTVRLSGELDLHEADWVEEAVAAAAPHHSKMVVDLHGLDFIDSTGMRALLTLKDRARILGITLDFANPAPSVRRTLGYAGLLGILTEDD